MKLSNAKVYLITEYGVPLAYRAFHDSKKAMMCAREIYEECSGPNELENEWEEFTIKFDGPYCGFEVLTVE